MIARCRLCQRTFATDTAGTSTNSFTIKDEALKHECEPGQPRPRTTGLADPLGLLQHHEDLTDSVRLYHAIEDLRYATPEPRIQEKK